MHSQGTRKPKQDRKGHLFLPQVYSFLHHWKHTLQNRIPILSLESLIAYFLFPSLPHSFSRPFFHTLPSSFPPFSLPHPIPFFFPSYVKRPFLVYLSIPFLNLYWSKWSISSAKQRDRYVTEFVMYVALLSSSLGLSLPPSHLPSLPSDTNLNHLFCPGMGDFAGSVQKFPKSCKPHHLPRVSLGITQKQPYLENRSYVL